MGYIEVRGRVCVSGWEAAAAKAPRQWVPGVFSGESMLRTYPCGDKVCIIGTDALPENISPPDMACPKYLQKNSLCGF